MWGPGPWKAPDLVLSNNDNTLPDNKQDKYDWTNDIEWGTQSTHSLCKVSYAIDSDAGDGINWEKFGRKDPGL